MYFYEKHSNDRNSSLSPRDLLSVAVSQHEKVFSVRTP